MAKDKADLDDELIEGLRQAKKKPRNFAVVLKGSKVLKLIVRKKPIKTQEILEAKSEVKGTDYIQGVCQGDGGAEIVFRVVGPEPGVKAPQFKELIAEQTGLTIKPRFESVKELQEVNDDGPDDGPSENVTATDTTATTETTAQQNEIPEAPPLQTEQVSEAKALLAKLNKIAPAIQTAVTNHPNRKNDVLGLAAKFKKEVADSQFDGAKETMKGLATLLKELSVPPQSSQSTTPQPGQTQTQETQTQETQAQETQAQQTEQPQQQNENPLAGRWEQEFPKVEEEYLAALKKADDKLASQLRVLHTFATEQAEAGAYDRAFKAVDRLKPLLQQALSSQGPGGAAGEIAEGTVAKRRFLLDRFNRIPGEVKANLRPLRAKIAEEVPDEDPKQLVDGIETMLGEFYGEMREAIDESINAGDGDYAAAVKKIDELKKRVRSDGLVQLLMRDPLKSGVNVEELLLSALGEVEGQLAG
jgi:hypothetical protein